MKATKTEAELVRPRKKDGRKKGSKESDRNFRRVRTRLKSRWEERVLEEIKRPRILGLEGKDPGSEVVEENHKGGKDEQDRENVKLRVLELEVSGCYPTGLVQPPTNEVVY